MPKNRLKDITVKEVSFVPMGDNPGAEIVIFKARPTKREQGEDFPAEAYAYAPEPSRPSTWKLRLWDNLEDKETAAQVGRAVAALGVGFRGEKVQIPSEDLQKVKAKVLTAWRRTHEGEPPSVLTKKELGGGMTPEELQAALDEANAENEKLKMELEALKEQLQGEEEEPEEGEMIKSLPEPLRKEYEQALAKAKEADEKLEKAADEALGKEWLGKAKDADLTDEVAAMFKSLAKTEPDAANTLYEEMSRLSKALNEAEIFKENGGGGGHGDAKSRIDAMAKERAASKGITYEKAYAEIYKENADLRKELKEGGK